MLAGSSSKADAEIVQNPDGKVSLVFSSSQPKLLQVITANQKLECGPTEAADTTLDKQLFAAQQYHYYSELFQQVSMIIFN